MSDEIDMANDLAELALNIALRNMSTAVRKLEPKGACYYCEGKVTPLQLYCDSDCASDHEKEQKIKARR